MKADGELWVGGGGMEANGGIASLAQFYHIKTDGLMGGLVISYFQGPIAH